MHRVTTSTLDSPTTSFLTLDLDSEDPRKALVTARELCRYLVDVWGAPEVAVAPAWSGQKGVHLSIAAGLFGSLSPSVELPAVFRKVRGSLVRAAGVRHPETVDYAIGDRLRLLRLVNTRHSATGLYKVPLSVGELSDWDLEDVVAAAREPRRPFYTDATGLRPRYIIDPLPAAVDLYEQCRGEADPERMDQEDLPDPATFLSRGDVSEFLCEAERALYESGVPRGHRTHTALRFGSRMRAAGYTEEEAAAMALAWNERNDPPERVAEIRRAVASAYSPLTQYHYGCGTGKGDPPGTSLVFEACPYDDRLQCPTYSKFSRMREA